MSSQTFEVEQLARSAPVLEVTRGDGFLEFSSEQCKSAGAALAGQYATAKPFPHIVLDNFLPPEVLSRVVDEFPTRQQGRFEDNYSQLKTGYVHGQIRSAYIQDLLRSLNCAAFLFFLQNLTRIKGLIADSHFLGGGLHETARGGHLSIHADFNMHPHMKLQRRLNLILFLNEEWNPEWGGALELWDRKMIACRASVDPVFNRAVVFNTDSTSFHGHPDPLNCPPEVFRRSIALYYYTVPNGVMLPHTTRFQRRPGSSDHMPTLVERFISRAKRTLKPQA